MEFGFIFWVFLIGIVVAASQDLKRREVDNWLNLFLLITSFSFIFFRAIFEKNADIIFQAGFALVVLFIFMNVFYYGRIFAGGDAKLLFAMTIFFLGFGFLDTLINIGIFLLFLMFSGSVYGLVYSFVLYLKNFKEMNKKLPKEFSVFWIKLSVGGGIFFLILGYFDIVFLVLAVFSFLLPLLYVFAHLLEEIAMVKKISVANLREGDWLVDDVKIDKKNILADWDGLSLEDIVLMQSKKNRKRFVKIKEGLPFVPAFLIAFIVYSLFRDAFLSFINSLA